MTRPAIAAVAAGALAVLTLAACGGTADVYTADATARCLAPIATIDRDGADYIAASALDGYLVTIDGYTLNVAFGATKSEGDQLRAEYATVGTSDAPLYQVGNAVLAWDETPAAADKTAVDSCLR